VAGRAEELLVGTAVLGKAGEPQAGRDRNLILGESVADGAAKAVGKHVGAVLVGVGEEQRELLAAHPRQRVDPPLGALEYVADRLQHLLGSAMAQPVVDLFEAIDVAGDHAEAGGGALRALELAVEQLLEAGDVEEAGAGVASGGLGEVDDQTLDAALEQAEQDAREADGAHGDHPALGAVAGRHPGEAEVARVAGRDEPDLDRRAAAAKEVEGVEPRPDVNDREELTRAMAGEIEGEGGHDHAGSEGQVDGHGGQAAVPGEQRAADGVRGHGEHEDARYVEGVRMREEYDEGSKGRAAEVHVGHGAEVRCVAGDRAAKPVVVGVGGIDGRVQPQPE
jgi:hypothetical protein